jgi:hypothetical protein
MVYSPPGPMAQKINALLHQKPWETIAYGLYWSLFILACAPTAVLFLAVSSTFACLRWSWCFCFSGGGKGQVAITDLNRHDLAVVITGCDSGFGKELALWTATAGYTVFAGCLLETSMRQFDAEPLLPPATGQKIGTIIPVKMDVTSNQDVASVAKIVSDWLVVVDEKTKENQELGSSRKRSLHALINNAGIGAIGEIDWLELSDFEKPMEGTFRYG